MAKRSTTQRATTQRAAKRASGKSADKTPENAPEKSTKTKGALDLAGRRPDPAAESTQFFAVTPDDALERARALTDLASRLTALASRMKDRGLEEVTSRGPLQFRRGYFECSKATDQFERGIDAALSERL